MIIIHCVVGHGTMQSIGEWFAKSSTQASSNYLVDDQGRVAMYVEEKDRSWCSGGSDKNGNPIRVNGISGADVDHRAIAIEVSCDPTAPYKITDGALQGVIKLCADICQRNDIKQLLWKGDKSYVGKLDQQNLGVHRWFANKSCPGDYIYGKYPYIVEEVNKLLKSGSPSTPIPQPVPTPSPAPSTPGTIVPYLVTVTASVLNYRKGPGTNYSVAGSVKKGEVYTIVEESAGAGASKWGKLKSGAGWISLDFAQKR